MRVELVEGLGMWGSLVISYYKFKLLVLTKAHCAFNTPELDAY